MVENLSATVSVQRRVRMRVESSSLDVSHIKLGWLYKVGKVSVVSLANG